MIVNSIIAIGLMPFYGWIAAPIATTISAWAMIILLVLGTKILGRLANLLNFQNQNFCLLFYPLSSWDYFYGEQTSFSKMMSLRF